MKSNVLCNICGSGTRVVGSKRRVRAIKCLSCGFVWKDFDHLPDDYWETWKLASEGSFDFRNQDRIFEYRLSIIKEHAGNEKLKILDFGCGHGEFVRFLRKKGYEAHGCDTGADTPKDEFFFKGDIKDLGLADFDVIVSIETFEHLNDPKTVMRELAARLKKGGILYLQTHYTHIKTLFGWRYFNFAEHRSFYCPSAMERLMCDAGIKLVYSENKRQPFYFSGFLSRNMVHLWCSFAPYSVKCFVEKFLDRPKFGRHESASTNKDYVDEVLKIVNALYIGKKTE